VAQKSVIGSYSAETYTAKQEVTHQLQLCTKFIRYLHKLKTNWFCRVSCMIFNIDKPTNIACLPLWNEVEHNFIKWSRIADIKESCYAALDSSLLIRSTELAACCWSR